ncbi:MAG: N-acetylmuramoyl-L-alanine amidase-like domain-containing protein [Sumerlaeia bacterium]
MTTFDKAICLSALLFSFAACASKEKIALPYLTPDELVLAEKYNVHRDRLAAAKNQPLYKSTPREMVEYIKFLHEVEPDLQKRVVTIARKNIGQPYELYLLGEAPFETIDPQPLVSLEKSDCVVFAEHTYAMALSTDWESFFRMLQRIRYNNGEIGVTTRNHYTEADWNRNNAWLLTDISQELAQDEAVKYTQVVNRERFFKNRYDLEVVIPNQEIEEYYVPMTKVMEIADQLQDGDFVNYVRGKADGGTWVGHVGIVASKPDGTKTIIHSAAPKVREQDLLEIVESAIESKEERWAENNTANLGFKFLRLQDNPMQNLIALDGDEAPKITLGKMFASGQTKHDSQGN